MNKDLKYLIGGALTALLIMFLVDSIVYLLLGAEWFTRLSTVLFIFSVVLGAFVGKIAARMRAEDRDK